MKPISAKCDAARWLQGLASGPLPAGIERSVRTDGAVRVHFAGRAPAGEDEYAQLQQALPGFSQLPGYRGSAVDECAPSGRDGGLRERSPCLALALHVCDAELLDIASFFQARARAAALEDVAFVIELHAVGATGPRCDASDPGCLPVPFSTADPADAPLWCDQRMPIGLLAPGGACKHDGDCLVDGCNEGCVAWPEADDIGRCLGGPVLERAYCGCVRGQCRWFE